jgi:DNA-binding response OmpR family regulator
MTSQTQPRKKLALVVEDDPAARRLIELSLIKLKLDVHTAANGETALSFLQANAVDLVCLDLMLPYRSGFEICEIIRRSPIHAKLPVIIISARTESDAKAYAEEAGANAYLVKPFKRSELEAHTLRLLGLRPVRRSSR